MIHVIIQMSFQKLIVKSLLSRDMRIKVRFLAQISMMLKSMNLMFHETDQKLSKPKVVLKSLIHETYGSNILCFSFLSK